MFCWFVASVDWAIAQNGLRKYVNDTLAYNELQTFDCVGEYTFNPGSYVQAAIGDVS